jgi:amino acid adenylation domain-containing protein/thioester reductase-like protein
MDGTISAWDRQTLIEQFNATDNAATLGFCLPQLFESAAERYPRHIAVISGNTEFDYQTVNALANCLAHVLVEERGVGHGDVVGVALDRSVDMVVAALAVMKSGAAYAPIDPAFPAEHITHTIDDAKPKLVLAGDSTLAALPSRKDIYLSYDEVRSKIEKSDSRNLSTRVIQQDDLAYVIYTSGSTGRPKGVEANHGALCNLLLSMQREPGCGTGDRLLAVAPVAFDMSIFDLFVPLVSGATTVIAQTCELRDPSALLGLMERHGITMIQATPSFFQMLLNGGWEGSPRLSKVLTAGEPVPRRLLERLLDCVDDVWEGYGPTEATVYSSVGKVSREDRDSVIGHPLANFRLYVLRAEDLSPVPLGSLGELYIGGVGVNCGYRNNPELTRAKFLENNPFHSGRLYRSGDLARFIAPGKLSLVGRTDSQVKVRGYRIELGDISAAISGHELVSEAIIIYRDNQLIAYYVRRENSDNNRHNKVNGHNDSASSSLDGVLRLWLAERRPAYMVPAYFVEMQAFPMTLNGKIDKRALPDPHTVATAKPRTTTADEPQTELERRVLAVWSCVLGHEHFGIHDNFFEVGGDSVRVFRLKSKLEKMVGRPVPAVKLFEHYTIKTLATYLDQTKANGTTHNKTNGTTNNGQQRQQGQQEQQQQEQQQRRRRRLRSDSSDYEDIAIVSMACRLPGGITTPEKYWELLEKGGDAITDIPKDRWDADALYDADPDAPGKSYCRRGGFIKDGVDSFDAPFFGISPREARTLDPMQSVMLETCWEGFERAGYTLQQLRGSKTGVFVGQNPVGAYSAGRDIEDLDGYAVTGSIGAALSGRVSYVLGLEGPAMTVDTACSSSLVATHLACTSLRQGECDLAVAGGVTIMLSPGLHVEFSRLRGMSSDGSCRAFDANTQGTGFSEGSTVILLKRLSDAQRDGDTVHAVLRGSAVNHGGRSAVSLTTPSVSAQERLIRSALDVSGLMPSEIDYIETHGTATKLGDPIEGTALAEVFRGRSRAQDPLWIGSVKSNIGHTQAAAGLAGMLKVVLALQHRTLPQTLHVTQPTPLVDWQNANMALVLKNRPWLPKDNKPRRAGVSSFGIGGTNAYIVVEEPPSQSTTTTIKAISNLPLPPALPFLLSGQTDVALRQQAEKLHRHILNINTDNDDHYLGDVAFSLATTRSHFRRRLVVMANNKADLLEKLASCSVDSSSELLPPAGVIRSGSNDSEKKPRLAMLFSGQGSQRLSMGKSLCEMCPPFREALEDIAAHFTRLGTPLLDVMWADPKSDAASLLQRTDFAQPAVFALEVALWRLWQSLGVQPQVVMGHSVGEIAAIHIAGVLDLFDACRLVASRGRLMQALDPSQRGSMVSLEATASEIEASISKLGLDGKVDIAGYNTPMQTVVSGDADAIEGVTAHFSKQLGRKTKTLDVLHAFHSFHMDDMLPGFRAVVETLRFNPSTLPVVSSLTGRLAEMGELQQPDYWVQQVRRAVRFSDGIQTLYHDQNVNVLLELGPQPVLLGMAAACLAPDQQQENNKNELPAFLPSLSTGKQDDSSVVKRSLAELHVRHMPIDWPTYFKPFSGRRVELPTYAFQRERYYKRPGLSRIMGGDFNHDAAATNGRTNGVPTSDSSSDRFQFEIDWHQIGRDKVQMGGGGGSGSSSWGLLCPTGFGALASEVKTALSGAGIQVSLVQQLQDAEQLEGLVCLWDDSSDAEVVRQAYEFTAKGLAQLQTAATMSFGPPLVWVTRKAVGIRNSHGNYKEDQDNLAKEKGLGAAPLWGLMRTARNEHPELQLRLIDLGEEKDVPEALVPALMLHDEPESAVRNRQLLVPQIQRARVEQRETWGRLQQGAVLITGGVGGIGKQVAKWLASTHHAHDLVLTSRRGMKATGSKALVGELAQLGATATVVACEISDLESLRQVMAMFSIERPLRGVIHAAGVVDNGVLSAMTPERCATVFAPKVDGSWHLHQLTQDMDLDLFIMFSSISGVLGMQGLGNYAAANTFLDALAHLRRAQGLQATSVAYGVWGGDGMAAGLTSKSTLIHLAKFGLDPLIPEDGLNLLEQAVLSGRALTVAAALDSKRLRNYLWEEEAENGEIPRFYRTLLQQYGSSSSSSSRSNTQQEERGSHLRKALGKATPEKHAAIVLALVRETVAKVLGFASADQVDVKSPLQDIGFDSLTAVVMRNQLTNLTGLKSLSASSITWNHSNLTSLSQFLLSQVQAQAAVAQPAHDATNGATPTTAASGRDMTQVKKGYLDPQLAFDNIGEIQRPEAVFLTGATGFVGAFILYELLELGIVAHCLVRARDADHGEKRLEAALASYDLWKPSFAPLLNAVIGDASKPLLGLSEEAFNQLADRVDFICHASALVDWMRPLSDYLGPNVVSVHEILRLAACGRGKAVHIISTLATLPMYMGYEVSENEREYGYSTSKYMAERMMAAARWRGAKASVYRVPFVTAAASTGHFRLDRGDFLHNMIAGSLQMGSFPSLGGDLSVIQPVDYLCKTIVAVMVKIGPASATTLTSSTNMPSALTTSSN